MVQTYISNARRAIQRFTAFIDNRRAQLTGSQPRQQSPEDQSVPATVTGQTALNQLTSLSKRFREFALQWSRTYGKQQSPLIDRIPPRGVEIWRDFWDTVRKQVRRINQEIWQMSRDMSRMLTGGRFPSGSTGTGAPFGVPSGFGGGREDQPGAMHAAPADAAETKEQRISQQFQEFYHRISSQLDEEQRKMNELTRARPDQISGSDISANSLIDEQDDEATRNELIRNPALRQQIHQEINMFGSIFDIMRAFISRLRESASVFRDILQPGAMNSNDAVTPGPSIKPTVDQLLEDTVNSQRGINGQAKPVLLPNSRQPALAAAAAGSNRLLY